MCLFILYIFEFFGYNFCNDLLKMKESKLECTVRRPTQILYIDVF